MSKKPLVVKPVLVEAIPNTNMTDYDRLLKNHGDPLQQEPIYQYQMANGSWIDQTKESHDYNVRHGQATIRVVYTSPPAKRTWVGLTDEERKELWFRLGYMDLMIAIEAKLKEKNT